MERNQEERQLKHAKKGIEEFSSRQNEVVIELPTHQDSGIEKIIEEFTEDFRAFAGKPMEGKLEFTQNNVRDWLRTQISQRIKDTIASIEAGKKDERPTEDGVPVETYGYEAEYNTAKDEDTNILKALLPKEV